MLNSLFEQKKQQYEDQIASAKTMKELQKLARTFGLKGYKKYKAKQKDMFRDALRGKCGELIGRELAQHREITRTAKDIEFAKGADDTAVPKQVKQHLTGEEAPGDTMKVAMERWRDERDEHIFRAYDVLPMFLTTLKEQEWQDGAYDKWADGQKLARKKVDEQVQNVLDGRMVAEHSFWESNRAMGWVKSLHAALNKIAPPGFHFGFDMSAKARGWGFWMDSAQVPAASTDVLRDVPEEVVESVVKTNLGI